MPTLEEIRRDGLDALQKRLGRAGMVQFLQLFETGNGDYVAQRRQWVDRTSLAKIRKLASRKPPAKGRRNP
jgi:hypothetical protein